MMVEKILDKFVKFLFMIKKKYIICKIINIVQYMIRYDYLLKKN